MQRFCRASGAFAAMGPMAPRCGRATRQGWHGAPGGVRLAAHCASMFAQPADVRYASRKPQAITHHHPCLPHAPRRCPASTPPAAPAAAGAWLCAGRMCCRCRYWARAAGDPSGRSCTTRVAAPGARCAPCGVRLMRSAWCGSRARRVQTGPMRIEEGRNTGHGGHALVDSRSPKTVLSHTAGRGAHGVMHSVFALPQAHASRSSACQRKRPVFTG